MQQNSSKRYVKGVITDSFLKEKNVCLFYAIIFAIMILVSFIGFSNEDLILRLELSRGNPLGIITSIFIESRLQDVLLSIASASFIILIFLLIKSISNFYNVGTNRSLSFPFMIGPLVSVIAANFIVFLATISIQSYNYFRLSGFQNLIQSLLGFTLCMLFYIFLKARSTERYFLVVSIIFFLVFFGLLFVDIFVPGFTYSVLFDVSKLVSLQLSYLICMISIKIEHPNRVHIDIFKRFKGRSNLF